MQINTTTHGLRTRVLADGRTTMIPRFQAIEELAEHGVAVDLDVAVDDWGRPRCLGLSLQPLGEHAITGETLRRIPVARLLRAATAEAGTFIAHVGTTAHGVSRFEPPSEEERSAAYSRLMEGARRPRQGSPVTAEHLRQVADTYRAALERREPPTASVAARWHVARPTASRWVAKARELGFLEPPLSHRGG